MKDPGFVQTISIRTSDPETLLALARDWDLQQASLEVMGYTGTRILHDRHDPEHFLIVAEFGAVEPGVPAAEEAARNNERPETHAWARRLRACIDGDPHYDDYDEVYRTG